MSVDCGNSDPRGPDSLVNAVAGQGVHRHGGITDPQKALPLGGLRVSGDRGARAVHAVPDEPINRQIQLGQASGRESHPLRELLAREPPCRRAHELRRPNSVWRHGKPTPTIIQRRYGASWKRVAQGVQNNAPRHQPRTAVRATPGKPPASIEHDPASDHAVLCFNAPGSIDKRDDLGRALHPASTAILERR